MKNKLKYPIVLVLLALFSATCVCTAAASEITTDTVKEEQEENFFTRVYEEVSEYTSEILSALALAGSITVAFAYKKGLLPLVERTLSAIGGAVTKIKESTKESEIASTALGETVDARLGEATEMIEKISDKLNAIEAALNKATEREVGSASERRQLKTVIEAQIDMLYDVFMSSALPQYQKDAVGEKISKMKEAISEYAAER